MIVKVSIITVTILESIWLVLCGQRDKTWKEKAKKIKLKLYCEFILLIQFLLLLPLFIYINWLIHVFSLFIGQNKTIIILGKIWWFSENYISRVTINNLADLINYTEYLIKTKWVLMIKQLNHLFFMSFKNQIYWKVFPITYW